MNAVTPMSAAIHEALANAKPPMDDTPRIDLVNAADVESKPIRWLWPGWLARGKLHVIAGAPGTGKTTIVMQWVASVSAGRAFPSGHRSTPGRVLIWSGEDDIADTLVPRLRAAGADLANVQFVGEVREGADRYPFDPARDVPTLAAALAGLDDVSMIVVDPLVSAVSGDSHKNAEVRRSLAPLVELAQRMDAALVGITHYSKGTQGREPLERVSGSLAFGAMARLVFGTVRQQRDGDSAPSKYLLARVKSNIGPDGGGFAYAFEQTELGSGITASRVVFGEAVEGSARELIGQAEADPENDRDAERDAPARTEAEDWLRDLLDGGPVATDDVKDECKAAGMAWATVRRAKDALGVKAKKQGGHFSDGPQRWVWELPHDSPEDAHAEDAHQTPNKKQVSTFSAGEHLQSTMRVSGVVEDAQFPEGAEDAHLPQSEHLHEHLKQGLTVEHVDYGLNAHGERLIATTLSREAQP